MQNSIAVMTNNYIVRASGTLTEWSTLPGPPPPALADTWILEVKLYEQRSLSRLMEITQRVRLEAISSSHSLSPPEAGPLKKTIVATSEVPCILLD